MKKYLSSIEFPDPRNAMVEGIVAVGGHLDVGTLYTAYRMGIFPWPQEGYPMLWFSPDRRGILDFRDLHVPKSLEKQLKKNPSWEFSVNKDFHQVIEECAKQPRPGQQGTWILPAMKQAYVDFFKAGFAMSVEVKENNILIGGIYGVLVEGVFSAESMFYKKSNASKLALWHLVDILRKAGHEWMDIQMVTPITETFGGKYVDREVFLQMLKEVHTKNGFTPYTHKLAKSFAGKVLFTNVALGIEEGEKIGLVGPNGAGKSTLLKILAGEMEADEGDVTRKKNLRFGFLEQTPTFPPKQTILQALLSRCKDEHESLADAYEWLARLDLTRFGEDF